MIGQFLFSNSFWDFVYKHSFSLLVDCLTHLKGNIILLDLVLTTSENIISDLLVTQPHALISTDHHTVSFNTQHATQSEESNKRLIDFSKADFEELCNHLLETDFSDCYNSVIVEDVWSTIKHAILYAMNLHIPMVKIKFHKHPKWYNSDIWHHLNC